MTRYLLPFLLLLLLLLSSCGPTNPYEVRALADAAIQQTADARAADATQAAREAAALDASARATLSALNMQATLEAATQTAQSIAATAQSAQATATAQAILEADAHAKATQTEGTAVARALRAAQDEEFNRTVGRVTRIAGLVLIFAIIVGLMVLVGWGVVSRHRANIENDKKQASAFPENTTFYERGPNGEMKVAKPANMVGPGLVIDGKEVLQPYGADPADQRAVTRLAQVVALAGALASAMQPGTPERDAMLQILERLAGLQIAAPAPVPQLPRRIYAEHEIPPGLDPATVEILDAEWRETEDD